MLTEYILAYLNTSILYPFVYEKSIVESNNIYGIYEHQIQNCSV